jgi:vacuolar-type H+-ATPase subunit I/STV1
MMAKKKILTEKEKVEKVFREELEDQELQIRYDRMVSGFNSMVENYNHCLKKVESLLNEQQKLKEMLFEAVKMKLDYTEIMSRIEEHNKTVASEEKILSELYTELEKERALIEKYKQWSENKFFIYWKIFKELDSEFHNWQEFKTLHKDTII